MRSARGRQRGAAMPEAIIVITTMLVFLGMIMFAQASYAQKIDLQTSTRSSVLFHASHACDGSGDGASFQGQTADLGADTSQVEANASGLRDSERAGVTRDWGIARSEQTAEVTGTAIVNLERVRLRRSVGAKSAVACNERSYDNRWTGLIPFAVDFALRGGGIANIVQ